MKVPSVFLSHSSIDKPFVRQLAHRLQQHNIKVWLDEAEINIGDSLVTKISVAVNEMDYLLVVLSHHSIQSRWVREELEMAFAGQLSLNKVKILPILKDMITIPPELSYLIGKRYANFTSDENIEQEFPILLRSLGVKVTGKTSAETTPPTISEVTKVTVHFKYTYEKQHWYYSDIVEKYLLFDNKTFDFKNEEVIVPTIPGSHRIVLCVLADQPDDHGGSYRYEVKSAEYVHDFVSGGYFYECDVKQSREWILVNKNEPTIQFVKRRLLDEK